VYNNKLLPSQYTIYQYIKDI